MVILISLYSRAGIQCKVQTYMKRKKGNKNETTDKFIIMITTLSTAVVGKVSIGLSRTFCVRIFRTEMFLRLTCAPEAHKIEKI